MQFKYLALLPFLTLTSCATQSKKLAMPEGMRKAQAPVEMAAPTNLGAIIEGGSKRAPAAATLPQASLTLANTGMNLCQANRAEWSLNKTGSLDFPEVHWTVSAEKSFVSATAISAHGFVRISNTGAGPASVLNIIANLQRKVGKNWVTVSSDVANSTFGDAALTSAVCSGASSEGRSSFTENAASGALEFTDSTNNTVFSLTPQMSLAGGQSLNLLFSAKYNNTVLGIPAGEQVRLEWIISFGNAGGRGGSGAVCRNIDANGNSITDLIESYVRSVPTRVTMAVPTNQINSNSVTLVDQQSSVVTMGNISLDGFETDIGSGAGTESLNQTAQRSVVGQLAATGSGDVTNCANLSSPDTNVVVNGPLSSLTGQPLYTYQFTCMSGTNIQACDTQEVINADDPPPEDRIRPGEFYSYTQGGWGAVATGNNPGSILATHFASVFPQVFEVGGVQFMTFTTSTAVKNYLPAGGTPSVLNVQLVNPTSTSAGVFGGQVTALKINVKFSEEGVTATSSGPMGGLKIANTGTSMDGKTIAEVLAIAETVLGGSGLPSDYTLPGLNELVTKLNEGFDNGHLSSWAASHLVK